MFLRTTFIAAAAAIGFASAAAQAATVYTATSHYENGKPEHSLWFGSKPQGASGSKANHFVFENTVRGEDAFGLFTVDGNKATLTGTVRNAALQGFDLVLDLIEVADPGKYKKVGGSNPDTSQWKFYDFTRAQLISKTAGIADFYLEMRGAGLKVQVGVGANDKDANLLGLSTWFTAREAGCKGDNCQSYHGDINIVLEPGGNPGVVPLPASVLLLPAALGMLGAAGGVARRRRQS
ncbi:MULTISPECIES: VPLPA-CTERM sorting domain-containing protein [unclassified Roseovarius]|uniref:VPLPA-CTERM sorting domain-containing protein n=1 Tax=unclassified Roseovarius TaxID=2614913 RepID=UPI00273F896A|nr:MULTISPECIES: VPLPA-CTERM sorting domain-containing protein [unclassified Roseovarius]